MYPLAKVLTVRYVVISWLSGLVSILLNVEGSPSPGRVGARQGFLLRNQGLLTLLCIYGGRAIKPASFFKDFPTFATTSHQPTTTR